MLMSLAMTVEAYFTVLVQQETKPKTLLRIENADHFTDEKPRNMGAFLT